MLEYYYDFEEKYLSQYACLTKNTMGRKNLELPSQLRTEYQRDRDRIIHCKAFRRLKHKTQVFLSPEGDHYRTRLTHTLEVMQVARTMARALRLNEDLTEAISLGHDLGHTPFGHSGERVLNKLNPNGFHHNEHSLRVVEYLENDGKGLNLTLEVRDGIVNHTKSGHPKTLEGKVVSYADRIAYLNHDIEDAITAGLLTEECIPSEITNVLGHSKRDRINTLITDIVYNSYDKPEISMTSEVERAFVDLRKFMFQNVYLNPAAKTEEEKVAMLIERLYNYFKLDPKKLPEFYQKEADIWGVDNVVTDYIASMTDNFALNLFKEVFVPKSWNI